MRKEIITFAFLLSPFYLLGQNKKQEQLITIEKARFRAMIIKDSVFLSHVLSDSLIYTHTDGETDSKNTFIRSIVQGELIYHAIEVKKINVTIKKRTAWINGRAQVSVQPAGSTIKDILISYLDVYRRTKNKWQLIAWQSAKIN